MTTETPTDIALLPCPFCGGAPVIRSYPGMRRERLYVDVVCRPCDLELDMPTREEAIIRWNTRADATELETLRALRDAK